MARIGLHHQIKPRIDASGASGITRADLLDGMPEWVLKRALKEAEESGSPLLFRRTAHQSAGVIFFKCIEDRAVFDVEQKRRRAVRRGIRRKAHAVRRAQYYQDNKIVILARKASKRAEKKASCKVKKTPSKPPKYVPKNIIIKRDRKAKIPPAAMSGEADYSRAVRIVATTPKPRFEVDLPPGYVSALSVDECNRWARYA